MKRLLILILLLCSMMWSFMACNKSQKPTSHHDNANGPIAITNGVLIDGTGSAPVPDAVVIIRDEHIESVGPHSSVDIPAGAQVINIRGAYILPGFMNTHVHSGYHGNNLREWARSGVTTVRDLGDFAHPPTESFSIRDSVLMSNKNTRLVAAGPMVTTVGGYGNFPVSSPDDAEGKINLLIVAGADLIKIAIEDDLQGRTWPMLSQDEIERIVQTAHSNEKRVAAHISRAAHLEMAIEAEVDDVAHMVVDYLPDSLIAAMIAKDMYWVPTLELWDGVRQLHGLNWDAIAKDNLGRFVQAGGKVAIGTDYDGYIFQFELGMPMLEIQLMQEAGMTAMQIIISGTQHAAHVCNLENKLGTLEPGKIADLIVVKDNPLDDLEALREVQVVIHNGEIIKDERILY
jgi:imidazolonepropionase-like amidohydrolase